MSISVFISCENYSAHMIPDNLTSVVSD